LSEALNLHRRVVRQSGGAFFTKAHGGAFFTTVVAYTVATSTSSRQFDCFQILTIKGYRLSVVIVQCTSVEQEGWLDLRQQLWPHCPREEHLAEMSSFCAQPERFAQFVAYAGSGQAVGFSEVAVRTDYVNGTDSSPVAFLEGIYVVPEARRMGTARTLVAAAERWAVGRGCRELASDAALENETSHAMHRALGFQETERVVFFRKPLT
jgi:aminoglycoside 6'-N-acetyltransferase I